MTDLDNLNFSDELSKAPQRRQQALEQEHAGEEAVRAYWQERQAYEARMEAYWRKHWSPEELLRYAQWRMKAWHGKDFTIDADNERTINILLHYFTGSEAFEDMGEDFSLQKGIFLRGDIGVGKTFPLRALAINQSQCYLVKPCRKVSGLYAQDGQRAIVEFSRPLKLSRPDSRYFWQEYLGLMFDDLGTEEPEKNNFGNKVNVMDEILQCRHGNELILPFTHTHLTTNLSFDRIETVYGTRLRSRCNEMFNIIDVYGPDRRRPIKSK